MTERFSSLGNLSIDDLVFVDGSTRWAVPGGNAVYAALGMAVWNERASVVAPFGPDYPIEALGDRVDFSHCPRIARSLRDWGLYEEDGSRQFVFRSETRVWDDFSPRASDVVSGTTAAHLAPLPWDRHVELIACLRQAGARTISIDLDDRNLAEISQAAVSRMVASVELFLPSRQDARAMFPKATSIEAVRRLRGMSPDTPLIAVKCGADGCVAHGAGQSDLMLLPAVPVKAEDPTGAGDAFCGGTLVGYVRTGEPLDAVLHGAVSASFCVEMVGCSGLLAATEAQALERMAALRQTVEFRPM